MKTTWIVAADSSRARIFEVQGATGSVQEVEDFVNPEGKMADRDLRSDSKEHFHARGAGAQPGSDNEQKHDPATYEAELFCRQVGDYLDRAGQEHRYDKLCLIAYSKILGMIRHSLSKETQKLVEDEVSKDISWFSPRDVEDYVKTRLH